MTETLTTPNPELVVLLQDSGLDNHKTSILRSRFADYFTIAEHWKNAAQQLTVTDESQTGLMKDARYGRLILREKRIAIEHTRKQLKEESLKEGKAIDAVARLLTGLIEPTEQFLLQQEEFAKRAEEQRQIARRQLIIGRRQLLLHKYNDDDTDDQLASLTDEGFDLRLQVAERNFTKKEEARAAGAEAQRKADQRNRDELLKENQRLQAEAKEREQQRESERRQQEAEQQKLRDETQKLRDAEAKRRREDKDAADRQHLLTRAQNQAPDREQLTGLADRISQLNVRESVGQLHSEQARTIVASVDNTLDKIQHWLREQAQTL